MNDEVVVGEFKKLAERLGIELRYIEEGPSGLCTLKGKRIMFINKALDSSEQVELFVREFQDIDVEGIFVVPVIRRLLESW